MKTIWEFIKKWKWVFIILLIAIIFLVVRYRTSPAFIGNRAITELSRGDSSSAGYNDHVTFFQQNGMDLTSSNNWAGILYFWSDPTRIVEGAKKFDMSIDDLKKIRIFINDQIKLNPEYLKVVKK